MKILDEIKKYSGLTFISPSNIEPDLLITLLALVSVSSHNC